MDNPSIPESQGAQAPPQNITANTVSEASSSVSQQPPAAAETNQQEPVAMYSPDFSSVKPKSSQLGRWSVFSAIAFLVLLIGASLYLWILPAIWANSYLKDIKPLYEQQALQMNKVYQFFNRPLSSSGSTSGETAEQGFKYISGLLATAMDNTNSLQSKDHLTLLPGTAWQHSASIAHVEYANMQQYTTDSQTFLRDYKSLIVYSQQFAQIAQAQLPKMVTDTNIINKGAATAVFITDLQNTTDNLQAFVNQLKQLKPPADLAGFNHNLLTDLKTMDGALSEQESYLQSNNSSGFESQKAVYISAYQNLAGLLSSDPIANIQTTSIIHSQLITVESEHPLK